jgi:hydrogenase nickel incorporation protein HypB
MLNVDVKKKILDANEECAINNTRFFAEKKIMCLNMISSPGSGKTTILTRTITDLKEKLKIAVVEGDIQTEYDAQRIRATGAAAVQINTQGGCHLTAEQVSHALRSLPLKEVGLVVVENVGNLVCPSAFELGEHAKVVVLSTAEGDDKPAKYPGTFAKAAAVLINKIDLLHALDFDLDRVKADCHRLNHNVKIFEVSAKTGEGMQQWYDWLLNRLPK